MLVMVVAMAVGSGFVAAKQLPSAHGLRIDGSITHIGRAWVVDRDAVKYVVRPRLCMFDPPTACNFFVSGSIRSVVGVEGVHIVAVAIRGYRDPGGRQYWNFLTELLPAGSRRSDCRLLHVRGMFSDSLHGQVRGCTYRVRGESIVVAQRLSQGKLYDIEGIVMLARDYSTLADVGDSTPG